MKSLRKHMILAAALALATPFAAQASPIDIGVSAGSLGVGASLGYTIVSDELDVRALFGALNYSMSTSSGNMNYGGNLNLRNIALLADVHPFMGSFRLTAGLIADKNKLTLNGTPIAGTTYSSGGATYSAQAGDRVSASVGFHSVAPYIGFGWGTNDKSSGFGFTSDIGLMYQGAPQADVSVQTADPSGQAAANAYAANAQTTLNNDLKAFKWYPVVQVGVIYRF